MSPSAFKYQRQQYVIVTQLWGLTLFYQNFLAVSLDHVEDVSKTRAGTYFPPTELNIAAFSATLKHLAEPWAAISSRSLSDGHRCQHLCSVSLWS